MKPNIDYVIGERVLCYEPDPKLIKKIYPAKIKNILYNGTGTRYGIHFVGWKNSWDWHVDKEFLLKDEPKNWELKRQIDEKYIFPSKRKKPLKKTTKKNVIEFKNRIDDSEYTLNKNNVGLYLPQIINEECLEIPFIDFPTNLISILKQDEMLITKQLKIPVLIDTTFFQSRDINDKSLLNIIMILEKFVNTISFTKEPVLNSITVLQQPKNPNCYLQETLKSFIINHTQLKSPENNFNLIKEFIDSLKIWFNYLLTIKLLFQIEKEILFCQILLRNSNISKHQKIIKNNFNPPNGIDKKIIPKFMVGANQNYLTISKGHLPYILPFPDKLHKEGNDETCREHPCGSLADEKHLYNQNTQTDLKIKTDTDISAYLLPQIFQADEKRILKFDCESKNALESSSYSSSPVLSNYCTTFGFIHLLRMLAILPKLMNDSKYLLLYPKLFASQMDLLLKFLAKNEQDFMRSYEYVDVSTLKSVSQRYRASPQTKLVSMKTFNSSILDKMTLSNHSIKNFNKQNDFYKAKRNKSMPI